MRQSIELEYQNKLTESLMHVSISQRNDKSILLAVSSNETEIKANQKETNDENLSDDEADASKENQVSQYMHARNEQHESCGQIMQSEENSEENVESFKMGSIKKANYKVINQMHAKLPFSGGDSKRDLKDAYQMRAELERAELQQTFESQNNQKNIDKRVEMGLVPAKNNKSKELSQQEEQAFQQVLKSSFKNFGNLLNIGDSSGDEQENDNIQIDQEQNNPSSDSNQKQIKSHQSKSVSPIKSQIQQSPVILNKQIIEYQDSVVQEHKMRLNLTMASQKLQTFLSQRRDRQFLFNFVKSGLVLSQNLNSQSDAEQVRKSVLQLVSTGAFKIYMQRSNSMSTCRHFEECGLRKIQIHDILRPVLLKQSGGNQQQNDLHFDIHPLKARFHYWQLKTVMELKGLRQSLKPVIKQLKAQREQMNNQILNSTAVSTSSSNVLSHQDRNIDCLQCFVERHDLQQNSLRAIGVVQGIIRRSHIKVFSKYFHRWLTIHYSLKKDAHLVDLQNKYGTDLQAELHQKMIANLNYQKVQCDQALLNHYQKARKIKLIVQKYQSYKQQMMRARQGNFRMETNYETAGLKTGLTVDDFDFLIQAFPGIQNEVPADIPFELVQKLIIYKLQIQQLKGINRKEKVEEKVRQMCYDMLVKVLEIQGKDHDKIQFELGVQAQQINFYKQENQNSQNQSDPNGRPNRKSQGQSSNQPRQMHRI